MRNLAIIFLFPFLALTQEELPIVTIEKPIEFIDAFHPNGCSCGDEAMFPGGSRAMKEFITKNFKSPRYFTLDNQKKRKVYVEFIVNQDGSLSDFEVVRGVSSELDQEVVNVLKRMPKWIPAGNSCEKFKTLARIPVQIEFL